MDSSIEPSSSVTESTSSYFSEDFTDDGGKESNKNEVSSRKRMILLLTSSILLILVSVLIVLAVFLYFRGVVIPGANEDVDVDLRSLYYSEDEGKIPYFHETNGVVDFWGFQSVPEVDYSDSLMSVFPISVEPGPMFDEKNEANVDRFSVRSNLYCCPLPEKGYDNDVSEEEGGKKPSMFDFRRTTTIDYNYRTFENCAKVVEGMHVHTLGLDEAGVLESLEMNFYRENAQNRENVVVKLCEADEILDFEILELRKLNTLYECTGRCNDGDIKAFLDENPEYLDYFDDGFLEDIEKRINSLDDDDKLKKDYEEKFGKLSENGKDETLKLVMASVLRDMKFCEKRTLVGTMEKEPGDTIEDIDRQFDEEIMSIFCEKSTLKNVKTGEEWDSYCTSVPSHSVCVHEKFQPLKVVDPGRKLT